RGRRTPPRTPYDKLGCLLQRLFSTFPNSWPGVGLLLLRVCLGVALIYLGTGPSGIPSGSRTLAQNWIAAAGGIFLLAVLWTPVMGTIVTLVELCFLMLQCSP